MSPLRFEITAPGPAPDLGPRAGRVTTPHGPFHTPAFMPVGTQATVKGLRPSDLREVGAEIVLANAYHLYLRPGVDVIADHGGLHQFMGWDGPVLTDSGGFQVFSLGGLQSVSEEGVVFRSHVDGSLHDYTPEKAVQVQNLLGADIIMPLDECLPYPVDRDYAARSVDRTTRWAERSLKAHRRTGEQALFGIVQGGVYADLRRRSARQLAGLDLAGYAVGGLSVGEPKEELCSVLEAAVALLPADRPRYLMGVGTPDLLIEAVRRGIDMFDCVLPTRTARMGTALVPGGKLVVRNAAFAGDRRPLEEGCDCYACRHFSRAYLRHLFNSREMLGPQLVTVHNLRHVARLMDGIRRAIAEGRFSEFADEFWARRQEGPPCG